MATLLWLVYHSFRQIFWSLTHHSSWKIAVCTASTLAYQRVSESVLEYLFILGKRSLRGTLETCLQISEGLSQGRRIRFVSWHPKGKIDTRTVVLREVESTITFIDVQALWWAGTAHAFSYLILKKDKFCLNFLTCYYDSMTKSLSWGWGPHHEGCSSRDHTTTWLGWEERDSSTACVVGDSKTS